MEAVSSPSILSKITYMKNMSNAVLWDTKDKQNINFFMTKYESYSNASGYREDNVHVRSFSTF
jgi:hypothetical protein